MENPSNVTPVAQAAPSPVNGLERVTNFTIDGDKGGDPFKIIISVPDRVGSEVTIPNANAKGGTLVLRDEDNLPIVRRAGESAEDTGNRALTQLIRYANEGKLEVKDGTLSPTYKFADPYEYRVPTTTTTTTRSNEHPKNYW